MLFRQTRGDMSITLEDLDAIRAAITRWKGAGTGAAFMGARVADLIEAWEQFVDTDWERWDWSEYDHDLDARYWLQVSPPRSPAGR
jgi:hypothetical protein